ncbi:MAG: hypothetical protein B7Z29_03985 [Hyphomicrobium sp. 12-62-95]|nr:MAG: hypothetical protein B7Z29_03985 [Hyphomicrobium sp. 12-62-95]
MPTAVKICGITDATGLDAAVAGGADYVGLVFFPKSPRNLAHGAARALRDRIPHNSSTKTVALVVDPTDADLFAIIHDVDPDLIQLHGHESLERVAAIRAHFKKPILKAIPVASAADMESGLAYLAPGRLADIVLYDAKPDPAAVLPGGNGLAFDWHILDGIKDRTDFALAGGLTPDNVAEAIARTVESTPGRKDPGLIRRFLQAAKGAKQGT